MKTPLITMLAASLMLAGCVNLAPEKQEPSVNVPQAWPQNKLAGTSTLPSWDEVIQNAKLKAVLALAKTHSLSLKAQALVVKRLAAQYQIAQAQRLPGVAASAQYDQSKTPKTLTHGVDSPVSRVSALNVGVFGYELDFFSRVKNLSQAALENYLASEQGQAQARALVMSQVVQSWLTVVNLEQALQRQTTLLDNQNELLRMVDEQVKLGAAAPLVLTQARAQQQAIEAKWHALKGQLQQARLGLNEVVGTEVPDELIDTQWVGPYLDVKLLNGAVSDVLLARPDIKEAEHRLEAARANVGAARALYFPQIQLMGSVGTMAPDLSDLFSSGSFGWKFTPSINWSIFNWGATQAQVEVAKVDQEAALVQYETAVRHAFTETAQSIVSLEAAQATQQAQEQAFEAAKQAYLVVQQRYEVGSASFNELLQSQDKYLQQNQALTQAQLTTSLAKLALYRAMGGGDHSPMETR